jgi:RHS repeat-associated protein
VVWCSLDICESRQADGVTVATRSFLDGAQTGTTAHLFQRDHLASISSVTDQSAGIQARYESDAWGRRSLQGGNDVVPEGFTSHRWNDVGQVWFAPFRAYDPGLGRWLSEDPIGLHGGMNMYEYARNRVVSLVDLDGLSPKKPKWPRGRTGMRLCDGDEYEKCAGACGGYSRVTRCTVNTLLQWIQSHATKSGDHRLGEYKWVDQGVTCKCKDDDDSTSWRCNENCLKVLVFVAAAGKFVLDCVRLSRGMPPLPAQ